MGAVAIVGDTMSYVESALVSGETVRYTGYFHWTDRLGAWLLLPLVIGLFLLLRIWTTEMAVTDRRLIYKRGWIFRTTEELSLRRIEEVNLRQGILGRILGYGTVQVQGMGGSDIRLPSMGDPMRFKRELQEAQVLAEELREH